MGSGAAVMERRRQLAHDTLPSTTYPFSVVQGEGKDGSIRNKAIKGGGRGQRVRRGDLAVSGMGDGRISMTRPQGVLWWW